METQPVRPSCPFCAFTAATDSQNDMYFLLQHLELSHPENGESPFIAVENGSESRPEDKVRQSSGTSSGTISVYEEEDVYVQCPARCGESVILAELRNHMDLHSAEDMASFDVRSSSISQDGSPQFLNGNSSDVQTTVQLHPPLSGDVLPSIPSVENFHASGDQRPHKDFLGSRNWREALLGPARKKTRALIPKASHASARRLGKSELGPHAFEERMPAWLLQQLQRGPRITSVNQLDYSGRLVRVEIVANETPNILPVLAQLCEQDPAVSKVFLSHAGVKHVFKMAREGGFCGYRNLQMMISFIQATKFPGYEHFPGRTPSILLLQDLIEQAWDQGINSSGRVETGGIKGTRKYIGTPEAQALLCSLKIGCEASAFNKSADTSFVHDCVYQAVFQYFSAGVTNPFQKVYQTGLAPIYFQHPGHSLTIIGLEVRKSGAMNLLVLDPMFKSAPAITRLIGAKFRAPMPDKLLKAYRRGDSYLQKYTSFEILKYALNQYDNLFTVDWVT